MLLAPDLLALLGAPARRPPPVAPSVAAAPAAPLAGRPDWPTAGRQLAERRAWFRRGSRRAELRHDLGRLAVGDREIHPLFSPSRLLLPAPAARAGCWSSSRRSGPAEPPAAGGFAGRAPRRVNRHPLGTNGIVGLRHPTFTRLRLGAQAQLVGVCLDGALRLRAALPLCLTCGRPVRLLGRRRLPARRALGGICLLDRDRGVRPASRPGHRSRRGRRAAAPLPCVAARPPPRAGAAARRRRCGPPAALPSCRAVSCAISRVSWLHRRTHVDDFHDEPAGSRRSASRCDSCGPSSRRNRTPPHRGRLKSASGRHHDGR